MSKDYDHEFKIILLGESGVGKTSLTLQYTVGTFKARGVETVVADFFSKTVTTRGIRCKLSIWDTAGQERYKSTVRGYYRNVAGVLLVYDVTDIMTFNQISSWLKEIREASGGATALVVGNKTDHPNGWSVSRTVVKRFARDENLEFIESSAKTGENVDKIFEYLTLKILQDKRILPFDVHLSVSSFISLDSPQEEVYNTLSTKSEQTELDREIPALNHQEDNSTENPEAANAVPIETETSVNKNTSPNRNISETAFLNGTSKHISQNFIELPPIVPLTGDIIELYVEKRRKSSTGSVISFMPDVDEDIECGIKLHEVPPKPQKPTSSCSIFNFEF